MSGKLIISEKHGVNPCVLVCPICGQDSGVAMLGKLKGDAEAPRQMADPQPCKRCAEAMAKGVIFLSVRDGEGGKNPYRTGKLIGLTEEAAAKICDPKKSRVYFMEDSVWEQVFGNVELKEKIV